jgi:galactonate dehydratase
MKIWPFDPAAEATGGVDISTADLKAALKPFEKIRSAVGDRMDVMVEFHSLWQLLPAMRIAKALTPFDTKWREDPIRMDSLASLKRSICASETLGSRWAFRDLLETGAAGVIMLDLSWCNAPNAMIQESVRAYCKTWPRDLVTALPAVRDGFITVPAGPGLGMELAPDITKKFTATVRVSKAES